MLPFKISTKWITIEVYRRGIVFSVATILLTSGVSLCNEEIIIALISIINKQLFHNNCDNYGLFVGLFLILISLFLYYLLIINWRKEIYSKTFLIIRKAVDSYGTSWRSRIRYASAETLRPLHNQAQVDYEEAFHFIRDNQAIIDSETYSKSWELLNQIGEEIIQLDIYIKKLDNPQTDPNIIWDPEQSNREAEKETQEIVEKYKDFVSLIKEKEKYRIK